MSSLLDFRLPVRTLLGDRDPVVREYSDDAIDDAVEVAIRMGKLADFTTDGTSIFPSITTPNQYALLVYEVVKSFVDPNPARYSFRTRGLSESFGSWALFLSTLEDHIHELRNGTMFGGWSDLHTWLVGVTGLDLATVLSTVTVDSPMATFHVGTTQ